MSRDPRDRQNDPFEDMFRLMGRMMEEMAANVDRMMGPFGSINVDVNPGPDRAQGETGHGPESHVDVQEASDEIQVVADLPGVPEEGIDVRCNGNSLSITADGEHRGYSEQVRLPAQVDEQSATATYNNGILDVRLTRRDTEDDDTTVRID